MSVHTNKHDRSLFDCSRTPTYLAVDLTNWVHQAFHRQGGHGVLETVGRRIHALTNHVRPKLTVLCLDDRRNFRYKVYPRYKANRPHGNVEGLHEALNDAPDKLKDFGVMLKVPGFEADDVLAAVAHHAVAHGNDAVIATPDKDLNQVLIRDRVTIIRKFTLLGSVVAHQDIMTAERLHADTGLTPQQWIDYQTLVGDSTDGIPGCLGWGKKTAREALVRFSTIERIYQHIDDLQVSAARKASLINFRENDLAIMKDLVTLRTDIEAVQKLFITRRRLTIT